MGKSAAHELRQVRRWVEENDEPWPASINAYHDAGNPDRDCARRIVGSPPRGAGVRRADRQQSNRHTASHCRDIYHASSNPVCHHDTGGNDRSNCCANSGSDCHAGADAPSNRDGDSNGNASADSHGDSHRDEGANSISHQDRERDGGANDNSANDDPDCDTGSQAIAHDDAHPGKYPDAHSTTERQREGDTRACASGLDEHHL
jgi:hypothetical protein